MYTAHSTSIYFFFLAGGLSLATGALHATLGQQPSTDDQQKREYKHASSLAPLQGPGALCVVVPLEEREARSEGVSSAGA